MSETATDLLRLEHLRRAEVRLDVAVGVDDQGFAGGLVSGGSMALIGRASKTPTKPSNWPNASKAKITARGCRPMRSPTQRGVNTKLSSNCPKP